MARDYKNTRRGSEVESPPKWRWFLAGFTLGATLSALVLVTYEVSGLFGKWMHDLEARSAGPQESPPLAEDRAPASKPKFEFYTMLPEMEVTVPESEIEPPPVAAEEPREEVPEADQSYVLQVGSFRQLEEADRQKATLALLGLEADIQTVSIDGDETWHRVRLGPYKSLDALTQARGQLYENQIDAIVLKLKN